MPHTIYFRVGNSDRITLNAFIAKLRTFLGLLEDFDSALSDNPRGSLKWEIVSLSKNSPPEVGISSIPRALHAPNTMELVEEQVFSNIALLSRSAERGPRMPDAALAKIKSLASNTRRLGPSAIYVQGNGRPRREEEITESTLRNVKELTDPKYSAYGSIVGRLESLSVHRGHEIRVWDDSSGRPVRCVFDPSMMGKVKELLPATVMVTGVIHSNSAGAPIKLDLEELDLHSASDHPSPTIEQMSGLVEDFTGGRSLKEYLEDFDE